MPTARDNQRSKFFKWFYSLSTTKSLNANDLRAAVADSVFKKSGIHPTFISTSGTCNLIGASISINIHQTYFDYRDAAKLTAYKLIQLRMHKGETLAWHGPEFCRIFAESYAYLTGRDVVDSMLSMKIQVEGFAPVKKIGIRAEKRRAKLVSRADEIELSIENARKEFEEWLKPAINELNLVRQELLTM